jgi:hypothetical protein
MKFSFGGTDDKCLKNEVCFVQIGKGIYGLEMVKDLNLFSDVEFNF